MCMCAWLPLAVASTRADLLVVVRWPPCPLPYNPWNSETLPPNAVAVDELRTVDPRPGFIFRTGTIIVELRRPEFPPLWCSHSSALEQQTLQTLLAPHIRHAVHFGSFSFAEFTVEPPKRLHLTNTADAVGSAIETLSHGQRDALLDMSYDSREKAWYMFRNKEISVEGTNAMALRIFLSSPSLHMRPSSCTSCAVRPTPQA